eukprot:g4633.t1
MLPSLLSIKTNISSFFNITEGPPCRGFTPKLAESYKTYKANGKPFEIVFVSSDSDEKSFKEYYGEQPWTALPYSARDLKAKVSKKFKVQGIPSLVILDTDGKTITKDGRAAVVSDPTGKDFPWKPKPIGDLLGDKFVKGDEVFDKSCFKGKVLGIYFSAHWCPPCRGFTPILSKFYNKVNSDGEGKLEILFASSDRDQKSFDEYFSEHPWKAIPFSDRERKENLSRRFGVRGIPTLVLLDEDMNVITQDGTSAVRRDAEGKDFPNYGPKPVTNVNEDPSKINDTPAVVFLMERASESQKTAVMDAMKNPGAEALEKAKKEGEDAEMVFYYADKEGPISGKIRSLIKSDKLVDGAAPLLAIVDVSDQAFYLPKLEEISESGLRKVIDDFKNGKLEAKTFG